MVVTSTNNYSYGIACTECNDGLIAPNWSEYVSEHHIRHCWSESCGYQFETSEHLTFQAPSNTRRRISPLLSLVT
jgi:hypothetical protein